MEVDGEEQRRPSASTSRSRSRRDADDDADEDEDAPSDEEEGIDIAHSDGDSSEEEDEDPEEEARIREGFIVDEDEDREARRKERRRKKKRKHREREFEALSEDDLDLVEQNTGVRIQRPEARKVKKLKRAGAADESSDDQDEERGLDNLFDDARPERESGRRRGEADTNLLSKANRAVDMDDLEDDMADFIEEDSPDEGDEEMREARAKRKRQEKASKRRQAGSFAALGGLDISAEAWDEIQEVFGDGHDYDEALESEDEEEKPQKTIRDVFEPSEIAERMMTDADDIIRAIDIPERMQIAQAGIAAKSSTVSADGVETTGSDLLLEPDQIDEAARWVSTRISDRLTDEFIFSKDGREPALREPFMAVMRDVLRFMCCEYYEVPFIWVHRRDFFIYHNPDALTPAERSRSLLGREDLWKVYSLAIKYRALLDRKESLLKLWQKLNVDDHYFSEMFEGIDSLEEAADLVEYVTLKYRREIKALAANSGAAVIPEDAEADAVRTGADGVKYKRATSTSKYETAKDSLAAKFAEQIALPADALAQDFLLGAKQHFLDDPPRAPEQYAAEFADPKSNFPDSSSVIAAAKVILSNEIAKEPSLRKGIRQTFRNYGAVSVRPTESGAQKIDEFHPYHAFKYLLDKPIDAFRGQGQFLQILAAEAEGLVVVDIHVLRDSLRKLTQEFYNVYLSDLLSDNARAWNKIREDIVVEALQHHLLPLGARWMRDWLKELEEERVAARCAAKLEERADMAPYRPQHLAKGEVPRVLALSAGYGDLKRDFVYAVCLNARGRLIDHERFEDVRFTDTKEQLRDHILRLKPDVIIVGGFSVSTRALHEDVKRVIEMVASEAGNSFSGNETTRKVPELIWVRDEVARLYQNSKRGTSEFAEITPVARYCIGLARYAQNPMCEYAALGPDLTTVTFDPMQKLLPKDKLQAALEQTLVNIVNISGVDINKAVRDPYYRVLLPFVAGLGPRKANGFVKRINTASGGTLICRADLIKGNICTTRIFMNSSAFLRIPDDGMEEEKEYDILDSTRIHHEDYHIARKMAADAEDLDEEDIQDYEHPSQAVANLMREGDTGKLDELSLDDFAAALLETQHLRKRLTLYMIRDELQDPFSERRPDFQQPTAEEVFAMLTGETRKTLDLGLIIPVYILSVRSKNDSTWLTCRTDSGVIARVEPGYMEPGVQYRAGQTVRGQVIAIDFADDNRKAGEPSTSAMGTEAQNNKPIDYRIDLSLLQQSVETDDSSRRKVAPDRYYDLTQASLDKQALEAKSKKREGRQRRVVNHPNFHNFNAGQAEQYLANLQRGDCVIRPSSRGVDHLAVTWKVDDGVYQHIDVLELDKPNEFSLGRQLRIQGKYTYSDLDELIVSHVRAMARKVDEMMHSDKYKGSEADLRKWLQTSIMAEPTRSFYGFALDTRKPGNFVLSFLTKGYDIQSWSVTVEPMAFILQGNNDPAPNVTMLCNAFKSTYVTKMAMAGGAAGYASRTPYVGGRTPNPYASGMTPYQSARSPYVGNAGHAPVQQQQPPPPPRQAAPYMNPARMAQAGFQPR